MFLSPLNFRNFSGLAFPNFIFGNSCFCASPLIYSLAFGKLPENPVVTPNSNTQVIAPSAMNKFLQTVTVKPIPTTPTP